MKKPTLFPSHPHHCSCHTCNPSPSEPFAEWMKVRDKVNKFETKVNSTVEEVTKEYDGLKAEFNQVKEKAESIDFKNAVEVNAKIGEVTEQLAEKVSLPANYNLSQPTLVTDFTGDWGAEWNRNDLWFKLGNGTMETDTTNTKHGAKSIKITTNAGSNVTLRKDFPNTPIDIADKMQEVGFWLYVKDHTTISEISLQFISSTSGTYFSGAIKPRISGWNFIKMNGADFTRYGEASWRTINGFAFRVFANSNVIAEVSFDSFEVGFKGIPLVLFTFDDATIDNYTEAYKYMKSKGLKGTIYAVKSLTGTEGYMTEAQLKETNNGGWTIANHTRDHVNVSQQTKEGAKAQVLDNAVWLESIGCIKGAKHVAYPFGKTSDMVDEAMVETGMISGRTYSIYGLQTSPITHKYRLLTKDVLMTSTVDEILAEIDKAHKIGATCILVFHKILETPTEIYDWSIANFRSLVDKVYARGDKCLTIDEWYDGLSSPSYYFSR